MKYFFLFLCFLFSALSATDPPKVRIGHFPTITHAQGLIGHYLSRNHQGWFEKELEADVEWYVYNDGPTAMEAIFAKSIDFAYVGPSPAINAFTRSQGEEIRIISGACMGGSALVVTPGIKSIADFKGKRLATPQIGNTQDIMARTWLRSQGFNVILTGGDVSVLPMSNASILTLFQQGDIDAAWTVEPWVSRLILEANASIFFNESILWPETKGQYATTLLIVSNRFLTQYPELVQKVVNAHVGLTEWINRNSHKAKKYVNRELKIELTRNLSIRVLNRAWANVRFTSNPVKNSILKNAEEAYKLGFIKNMDNIKDIFDLKYLHERYRQNNKN